MTSRALNVQLRGLLTDMTTIATCQKVHPARSESPAPSRLRESDDVDKLVIPGALEELDPDDYPSGLFWTQTSWNTHKKNQVNQGTNPFNLGFIRNEDGTRVSKDRLMAMTKRAKQLWTSCYHLRMDPPTWTKKCDDAALFFSRNMRISFSEFSLCENDWKVEAFAVIRYPDWASDVRGSGTLTRKSSFDSILFKTVYALFQVNDHRRESERATTKKNLDQNRRNRRLPLQRYVPAPPSSTLTTRTISCHNRKVHFQLPLQPPRLPLVWPCRPQFRPFVVTTRF